MLMGCMIWPQQPVFADESEQLVWDALRQQLRDGDVLMHGVRFNDRHDGEVEIDLLVLMPDAGAAVIEVKGGHISYREGQLHQTGARGTKVIDPAGQAAKGVRALCRYLEGLTDWSRGKVRANWLVAFPYLHLHDNVGPQLRKDLVIAANNFSDAAGMVHDRLSDPANHVRRPAQGWVDAALDALLGVASREWVGKGWARNERALQRPGK